MKAQNLIQDPSKNVPNVPNVLWNRFGLAGFNGFNLNIYVLIAALLINKERPYEVGSETRIVVWGMLKTVMSRPQKVHGTFETRFRKVHRLFGPVWDQSGYLNSD